MTTKALEQAAKGAEGGDTSTTARSGLQASTALGDDSRRAEEEGETGGRGWVLQHSSVAEAEAEGRNAQALLSSRRAADEH